MNIFKRIKLVFQRRAWQRTILKCIARTNAYADRWYNEFSSPGVRDESFRYLIDSINDELEMIGNLYPDCARAIDEGRYDVKKAL